MKTRQLMQLIVAIFAMTIIAIISAVGLYNAIAYQTEYEIPEIYLQDGTEPELHTSIYGDPYIAIPPTSASVEVLCGGVSYPRSADTTNPETTLKEYAETLDMGKCPELFSKAGATITVASTDYIDYQIKCEGCIMQIEQHWLVEKEGIRAWQGKISAVQQAPNATLQLIPFEIPQ